MTADLLDAARALQPDTVALRRDLHRHPELGNDLPRTQWAVLDAIGDLGLDVRTGTGVTSVTATLDTGRPSGTMRRSRPARDRPAGSRLSVSR